MEIIYIISCMWNTKAQRTSLHIRTSFSTSVIYNLISFTLYNVQISFSSLLMLCIRVINKFFLIPTLHVVRKLTLTRTVRLLGLENGFLYNRNEPDQ